jgi:PTH1 family peptidyl-tRNA hydrolase
MHLVLGLGNPGARYAATRHNVGFLVVDALARRSRASVEKEQLGALTAKVRLGDADVVLAKPQKYMNLSGGPGQHLAGFYKVPVEQVVVVHDDMDIPFRDVRVKVGGGHGGHNGLRDLNARHGNAYVRVRVGVSRPPAGWDPADYVLGRWTPDEDASLQDVVETAADAVEVVVRKGAIEAQNQFNGRASAP